ncbi:TonB-dependent receptor [Hymenobacter sp. H14-R3]|uniref:SusC/RagA family TonB-linked outer membrane protein n=1 Tax=Hymenobacter sp. H14-R3 TaxID=3046308 RepID=UPI0024BABBD2|nr:TonB-dependent receptor [Hymenobacter sp. H14-R3]MDJ0366952.1 TonB-dependent receptor [Hymenobacter sp. H14-R3]
MKQPYLAKLRFLLFVLFGLTTVLGAWAQTGTGAVSGRVTDAKNEGIPGVTVLVDGTSVGGSTNADGTYTISGVPVGARTLVISFVGYSTVRQAVTVTAGQTSNVAAQKLSENATALGEAVVVGYGTQRKQDVTGAVTTVTAKDFVKGQITNPEQLVQGKIAGVQITSSGGAPGAANTIRIRGGSSLNASNDPLIVIDGVPVDNSQGSTSVSGGVSGVSNPLSLINPNDIETFTVLKDASATAIYGSRASNGVILITTKKGIAGETIGVNFSSQTSLSKRYNSVKVLSADEYRATVQNVAPSKAGLLGSANTNWQDEIFRTAMTYDNNLSLTGSIGKLVPFRVSYGNLNQQGILITNKLVRNTGSISLTPILLDDHLRVTLNVKGSVTDNNFADAGAIGAALAFDPTQPVTTGNGAYGNYFEYLQNAAIPTSAPQQLAPKNPVATLNLTRDRSTVLRSIGNVQLDYKLHFLPDLHANVNVGYDVTKSEGAKNQNTSLSDTYFNVPFDPTITGQRGGSYSLYSQNRQNKLLETYLNYSKQFGDTRLELLAGYSYQDFVTTSPVYPTYLGRTSETPLVVSSPAGPYPFRTEYTILSYYGRANLNIKDRYLLTATLRNDASSRFNKNNRNALFPAASVAWRIKSEDFLKDNNAFSELKLRAGYGRTGQQDVYSIAGDYPTIQRYVQNNQQANYLLGGVPYNPYSPQGFNSNLKWETTTTYNAGLDFGFLDGRLTGSVDAYYRKTTDLLNGIFLGGLTNFTNYYVFNVGALENRGIELNLNAIPVRTADFTWSVNANATYNKNKILSLGTQQPGFPGIETNGVPGGTGTNIGIYSVGQSATSFYVYKQVYDTNGKPLNDVYADLNGDGKVDSNDRYLYKQSAPPVILGFTSNMTYKQLSLAFTLRSNLGNYLYNSVNAQNGNYQGINYSSTYLTNVTQDANFTQFANVTQNRYSSDYYIQNASFLRMQNATLGYNVGKVFNGKGNLGLTAAVQNVFLVTKYTGLDPEISNGIDNNSYPRPRVYTFGLNLNI